MSQNVSVPAGAVFGWSGLHSLVILRSADSTTFVLIVTELSAGLASAWSESTLAVLLMFVVVTPRLARRPESTCTWMVNDVLAPPARSPRLQVSVSAGASTHESESER